MSVFPSSSELKRLFVPTIVGLAAVDLEVSSNSRACGLLSPPSAHLATVSPDANRGECSRKWNGLHSPIGGQSRLNLSIEVPSPSQVWFLILKSDLYEEQKCILPL